MKKPPRLTASFVKSIGVPGHYGEGPGGHGLTLRVRARESGRGVTKAWTQRAWICGSRSNLGLGSWPLVSLTAARESALANRLAIAEGRDPRDRREPEPSFREAFERMMVLHRPRWKPGGREERIWRTSFRRHVLPKLGYKRVSVITPGDILAVLEPIWTSDKQDLAQRLRQRIGLVMDWCIAKDFRTDNPAGPAIDRALPKRRGPKKHYRALHYSKVSAAINAVRESPGYPITALCFEFLVLTGARSGEARLARWNEIDLEAAVWVVPAERMKANRMHRVPLAGRTIEVLKDAAEFRGSSGLVFPSPKGKPLSDATLSKRLRDLGIEAVPHGFRSSLRDFGAEAGSSGSGGTEFSRAVLEAALAHRLGDAAEQAYARSDLFAKRAELMQAWADYLADSD